MKQSLRELLLDQHRPANSQLDVIRKKVVADLPSARETESATGPALLRDLFLSLRWHLTAIAAAWTIILVLNTESSRDGKETPAYAQTTAPQLAMALKERQRELMKLSTSPAPEPSSTQPTTLPRRRSQLSFIQLA